MAAFLFACFSFAGRMRVVTSRYGFGDSSKTQIPFGNDKGKDVAMGKIFTLMRAGL
jgi:hypothetical protein